MFFERKKYKTCLVLYVLGIALIFAGCYPVKYTATSEKIVSNGNAISPCNFYQFDSNIVPMFVNGELCYNVTYWPSEDFFTNPKSEFKGYVCRIGNGIIDKVCKADRVFGIQNDHMYYELDDHLWAYNFSTGTEKCLKENCGVYEEHVFDEDGGLKILFCNTEKKEYYNLHIKDGCLLEEKTGDKIPLQTFQISDRTYYLSGSESVFCNGEEITYSIELGGSTMLVPFHEGLLWTRSNSSSLVYYITPDGSIDLLFPKVECSWAESCVTTYGHYVYLSSLRYKGFDQLTSMYAETYENDTISGTYKIDIRDYSYEKISDECYEGMFVFDDTGIIAVDEEGSVFKMDFDGNVYQTILEMNDPLYR